MSVNPNIDLLDLLAVNDDEENTSYEVISEKTKMPVMEKANPFGPDTKGKLNICYNTPSLSCGTNSFVNGEIPSSSVNSVEVENITNSLAEKININNIETNTGRGAAQVIVIPDKVVTKVSNLAISGAARQSTSDNKSSVVINKKTDSLKKLLVYDSSSTDEEIEGGILQDWVIRALDKSGSDSNDSESSSDDDEDDIGSVSKKINPRTELKMDSPVTEDFILKVYSENNLHDLPPVRDVTNLDIDVEKEEFLHMGHIEAVIETLVTVEAIPGIPAYDLDTCLFVEHQMKKRALGAIYDVIGPVLSPLYCIRFEHSQIINEINVKKGMKVFCAPKSKYTRYVFLSELMKNKGTDASWVGDIELPAEIAAQMSDDECEPQPQEPRKPQKRKHHSQERHKQFEENMNRCNTLNSQATRLVDAQRHIPRMSRYNEHIQRVLFDDVISQSSSLPPAFDPTVPPPGFHGFQRHQPVIRPPVLWNRQETQNSLRVPRCHPLYGQNQSYHSSGFTNNDINQGPGSSSHPY